MQYNSSSFRDPSGHVFEKEGQLYRSVNQSYSEHYERLIRSGLLDKLFQKEYLVKHEVVSLPGVEQAGVYKFLKPERLPVISYPYEWCFSQLKEAALLTLELLTISLSHGMILKDASSFNVQFRGYKPVFIDTLSFAIYEDGQPWEGYRQFCEHFLAPLCLSSYLGATYQSLSRLGVDGIPLTMASKLLPRHTWFRPVPLFHIHLHAKTVDLYSTKSKAGSTKKRKIPLRNLMAMADHLSSFIKGLQLKKSDKTQWRDYDQEKHYSDAGKKGKALILADYMNRVKPSVVWDIGANDGYFSRSVATSDRLTLSLDFDPLAIEKNFHLTKEAKNQGVYPLVFDVVNPSPDMGWANLERRQLPSRSQPDLIMALALIHHLVITNNIPFGKVADYFASIADWLIIEFVPTDDEKILPLPETAGKKSYSRENFESGFFRVFERVEERIIEGSQRSLLLLKKIKA